MADPKAHRYLALEVPDDQLLAYLAQEGGLTDVALDALEAQLDDAELDAGEAAAIALTVARAGRDSSRSCLSRLANRLKSSHPSEAEAVRLAEAILALRPAQNIERADSGYRMHVDGEVVFVEDPVAAHWHRAGRWGPPIRPDLERAAVMARGDGRSDEWYQAAADGRVVVVTFEPRRFIGPPQDPLRLTRCGLSRDADLQHIVRWSEVESLGTWCRDGQERVGFTRRGREAEGLPLRPSIPPGDLLEVMERLLKQSRSC